MVFYPLLKSPVFLWLRPTHAQRKIRFVKRNLKAPLHFLTGRRKELCTHNPVAPYGAVPALWAVCTHYTKRIFFPTQGSASGAKQGGQGEQSSPKANSWGTEEPAQLVPHPPCNYAKPRHSHECRAHTARRVAR